MVPELPRHRQPADRPEDYQPWTLTAPLHPDLPGGGGYPVTSCAIPRRPRSRGAPATSRRSRPTSGRARTWYWHGIDVTANARLGAGVNIQGARARDAACRIDARPWSKSTALIPRGCAVTEPWITAVRGLANYTIPKVDVLVSGAFRSPAHDDPLPASQQLGHQRASLAANYNVPNTVVQSLLGRLPSGSNANGTTTVNLVEPAQVYGDRVTQIDMRFAKIFRFGGTRRLDVGMDLYNLFNTNDPAGYEHTRFGS